MKEHLSTRFVVDGANGGKSDGENDRHSHAGHQQLTNVQRAAPTGRWFDAERTVSVFESGDCVA